MHENKPWPKYKMRYHILATDYYGKSYVHDMKTGEVRISNAGIPEQTQEQKNRSRNYSTLIMYGLLFLSGYLFLKTSPPIFSVLIISALLGIFAYFYGVVRISNTSQRNDEVIFLSKDELTNIGKIGIISFVKMIFLFLFFIVVMIFLLHFTITVMPNHIFRLLMEVMTGFISVFLILLLDIPGHIKLYYRILKS